MAIDWSKIKHFTVAEFGAHADKLDEQLIENLDEAREKLDTPIVVTSAYRPGDSGFHGEGLAIDLMLPNWTKTAYDAYLILQTCGFTGVGVYPYWKYRGKMMFGFHVDMRPKMARWIGLGSSKTDAQYVMFSNDNLKKYGLMK